MTDKEVDDVIKKARALAVSAGDVTKGGHAAASAFKSADEQAQVADRIPILPQSSCHPAATAG